MAAKIPGATARPGRGWWAALPSSQNFWKEPGAKFVPADRAGHALFPNGEHSLRPRVRLARLYPPELLAETLRRMLSAQVHDVISATQAQLDRHAPDSADAVRGLPPLGGVAGGHRRAGLRGAAGHGRAPRLHRRARHGARPAAPGRPGGTRCGCARTCHRSSRSRPRSAAIRASRTWWRRAASRSARRRAGGRQFRQTPLHHRPCGTTPCG